MPKAGSVIRPGPAEHHRHGGKGFEPGALVDEFELARIERVHADADAERVEDALALAVAHADVGGPVGHDPFVVQLWLRQCRLLQFDQAAVFASARNNAI